MKMNEIKDFCILYLVRHGQSEGNALGVFQGQKDYPLTSLGEKQTKAVTITLSDTTFSALYSSDLKKAQKTAEIINDKLGLEHIIDPKLRERGNGKFEGVLAEDAQKEYTKYMERFSKLSNEEKWTFHFGEGSESNQDAIERFVPCLQKIAITHLKENVLVITHGGVLRALLTYLGQHVLTERSGFKNTGIMIIKSNGREIEILDMQGLIKD